MDWLALAVLGLATWRLSSMLVREDGPAYMLRGLRELTGITHDDGGAIVMIPDRFFAQLLSCVYCASMWVGTFWVIFWLIFPAVAVGLASVFALSAVAVAFDRRMGH